MASFLSTLATRLRNAGVGKFLRTLQDRCAQRNPYRHWKFSHKTSHCVGQISVARHCFILSCLKSHIDMYLYMCIFPLPNPFSWSAAK